ncbi:phage integrase central domain-containing protein [Salmonella enterica]|uniref:phage integrase central domain-containing protein n=1 Tax=Salmonella enterica TaxID=28901 RepID=UPI00398C5CA7
MGDAPSTEIRPKMLKEHRTPLEEQGIPETLRRVLSRLHQIFRFATPEALLQFNPSDNRVPPFQTPNNTKLHPLHHRDM